MKKIFSLAIALIAFAGIVNAQTDVMQVNKADGSVEEYFVPDVESVTFGIENWEEWAVGTFYFFTYWYEVSGRTYTEAVKPGLQIYRSTLHPNRFRVAQWAYGSDADVDFFFNYDEETGEVVAQVSDTGETYYTYGEVYADEVAHYNGGTWTYNSYKEGDTFYLSLIYYCDGGYFGYTGDSYGDDYERLVITEYK